jgi:membrane protein
MKMGGKKIFELFKNSALRWSDDRAPQLGASLAFYTIFSLAPLLTIIVSIAALWFSKNATQEVFDQLGGAIGDKGASFLQGMLVQDGGQQKSGIFTTISAGVMLVLGATGVFMQLQDALNQIWKVQVKPKQGAMGFIRTRLLSFAMVLGIAFILLVSLVLTTAIAAIGKHFSYLVGNTGWLFQALNMLVSFGLIAVLFAFMFKYVPDAEISWKDVWAGAIFTSLLFAMGKFGLGLYLGHNSLANTYKAAGSLILILLWVYYNAQILFFGAEMTQQYAHMKGRDIQPSPHAEWDEGKKCQTQAAASDRERKKDAKPAKPAPPAQQNKPNRPVREPALPQPAYAMRTETPASTTRFMQNGQPKKATVGGLLLLLFVLVPIEKKLFGPILGRAKSV